MNDRKEFLYSPNIYGWIFFSAIFGFPTLMLFFKKFMLEEEVDDSLFLMGLPMVPFFIGRLLNKKIIIKYNRMTVPNGLFMPGHNEFSLSSISSKYIISERHTAKVILNVDPDKTITINLLFLSPKDQTEIMSLLKVDNPWKKRNKR